MKHVATGFSHETILVGGTYAAQIITPGVDVRDYIGTAKLVTVVGATAGAGVRAQILLQESADNITFVPSTSTGTLQAGAFVATSGTLFDGSGAHPQQQFEGTLDLDNANRFIRPVITVFSGAPCIAQVSLVGQKQQS